MTFAAIHSKTSVKTGAALFAALSLVAQSTASLIAAAAPLRPDARATPRPYFELLDARGGVTSRIDAVSGAPAVTRARPQAPGAAALGDMRALIAKMRKDPAFAKTQAARAERLALWSAVVTAQTREDRHRAVSRLGVTVRQSAAPDGSGTFKDYSIDGRIRVRGFEPLPVPEPPATSGPSDALPVPASMDDCYFEGQPDACASEQDLADVDAMAVWLESETDFGWESYNETTAEIDEYCSQNPWDCGLLPDQTRVQPSGPSADAAEFGPCGDYAASAVASLAASAVEALAWWGVRAGAAASGTAIAAGTTAAHYVALGAAGFFLGYYTAAYVDCKRGRVRVPLMPEAERFLRREAIH